MNQPHVSEADHVTALLDAMAASGIPFSGTVEGGGKLQRFYVKGDRQGSENGWLSAHLDERPNAKFGTWKGETFSWSAEGLTPMTPAERAEMNRRIEEKAAQKEAEERERNAAAEVISNAMWDAAAEAVDHPYLARKGVPGYGLRVGTWVKELPSDPVTGEIKTLRVPDTLMVPIRDERKTITSLQAIYPKPRKIGGDMRDKDFVYGGRKAGCWFTIGRPTEFDGLVTVVLCEGYATGASIHRATGFGVVVCFDAGNLIKVARIVRRLMPSVRIVIAADNDAWTKKTDDTPWNPGVEKGTAAAEEVGGLLVIPEFVNVDSKPTDLNDLDVQLGPDEVLRQFMAVLRPAPAPEPDREEPPQAEPDPIYDHGGAVNPDDNGIGQPPQEDDDTDEVDTDGFFKILGHSRTTIFIYQYEKKMIVERGETDWSEAALTSIAPLHWWEREFPGEKGMSKKMAINWLQRTAYKKGFFDPSTRRGRGAWRDDGRMVYHFGDRLMLDGVLQSDLKINSTNVYEQSRRLRLPATEMATAADGKIILEAAKAFHWVRPASAILLAGWCALAPICGALRWRPHIWITGGAGSGKSTILNEFALLLLNGASIYAQGNSTEAGIRQTIKMDALPVLFDESEQNNDREEQRIQAIIALIRQASTESQARTLKGTQGGDAMDFVVRSMFCLSSIQVGMKHQADVERLSVLAIRPKRDTDDAAGNWQKILAAMAPLKADPEMSARLMRRSLNLLPITIQNIEIFAQAAAEKFGSQRDGDQYGAMLAGAWSLFSTKVATIDQAREMIGKYEWSDYLESQETEESGKALATLLGKLVRIKSGIEVSIYELVSAAADCPLDSCHIDTKDAAAMLKRFGLMVHWVTKRPEDAKLLVAYPDNVPELAALLADSPYASDIKGQLLRVPGAERHKTERFMAISSRSVSIPMTSVLPDLVQRETAPDYDNIPF